MTQSTTQRSSFKSPLPKPYLRKRASLPIRLIVKVLMRCELALGDFILWLIGDRRL